MAEIVNLRRARKQLTRAKAAAEAVENRARHGRTPAEKARDAADAERKQRALDQVRLDAPSEQT